MSSSTMIHGATIRRESRKRTAADKTTIPATHTQAGTARAIAPACARDSFSLGHPLSAAA